MARKTTETQESSALELLLDLMRQHEELGKRIATITERAEAEMQALAAQATTSAAELDEAKVQLAELRGAFENETKKRMTAEARVGKLETTVSRMKMLCDEAFAEDDQTSQASASAVDVNVIEDMPEPTPLSETLGVTGPVLEALHVLTAMEGTESPQAMLRILLLRELERVGRFPNTVSESRDSSQKVQINRSWSDSACSLTAITVEMGARSSGSAGDVPHRPWPVRAARPLGVDAPAIAGVATADQGAGEP